MHCPACDKEFSPVHSRCPDCNGWLRTNKGAGVGAKSGAAAGPTGAGVTLPSRPTSSKPAAPSPSLAAPMAPPVAPAANSGGLGAPGAPSPGLDPAPARGGLGTGWENSGSFAAPAPAPAPNWNPPTETGKLPAWGAGQGSAGLGGPPGGLGGPASPFGGGPAQGFGAPPNGPSSGFGAPSNGLGAPSGFGAPSSGLGNGVPAAQSPPGGGGGGWLGGDGPTTPYAAPSKPASSWGESVSEPAAPVTMPSMPSAASAPALELPDHTVFVDMEPPWEEEKTKSGGNKVIYIILGCLILGLIAFFGYMRWQRGMIDKKPPVVAEKNTGALDLGLTYLKTGQKAFKAKKWEEAQANAELARDLIVPLKVAPAAKVKEAKGFFKKATTQCAKSYVDKANRAVAAGDNNRALGLCKQAQGMYARLEKPGAQLASVHALEGSIYERIGDVAGAESAYLKAASLHPGGNYKARAKNLKHSTAPRSSGADPEPEEVPEIAPSLGGDPAYPTGTSPGGYHPSSQPAATAPTSTNPAPPPKRVNTYVPPKKSSGSKPKSDQLPTYNH